MSWVLLRDREGMRGKKNLGRGRDGQILQKTYGASARKSFWRSRECHVDALETILAHLGAILRHLGAILGHFGAILGHLDNMKEVLADLGRSRNRGGEIGPR